VKHALIRILGDSAALLIFNHSMIALSPSFISQKKIKTLHFGAVSVPVLKRVSETHNQLRSVDKNILNL
jgi:hypothetical protein